MFSGAGRFPGLSLSALMDPCSVLSLLLEGLGCRPHWCCVTSQLCVCVWQAGVCVCVCVCVCDGERCRLYLPRDLTYAPGKKPSVFWCVCVFVCVCVCVYICVCVFLSILVCTFAIPHILWVKILSSKTDCVCTCAAVCCMYV